MQILVVVAIIQMRTLKTEAREGSAATAIVCRLGGPKQQVKPIEIESEYFIFRFFAKGNRVKIPDLHSRHLKGGNTYVTRDAINSPRGGLSLPS